ncbi:MAG: hypothetical protein EOM59_00950 [Clostridia bacterium]|nr:hypothetical protein [Clostridia bacterium]
MKTEAPNLKTREDRLASYLEEAGKRFLFYEFSEDYLKEHKLEYLINVPLPLKQADLTAFYAEGSIPITKLADNIAVMTGINPRLSHVGAYIKYLATFFDEKLIDVLTSSGGRLLYEEEYQEAAIYFRAALMLDPADRKAIFGYACACREWYLSLEGENEKEKVQALKDESMEYFEWTVELFPTFPAGYYFLGYAYVNLALYTKASLIWERFLELSDSQEEKKEIQERVEQLVEPVKIERGINLLTSGKIKEGLEILEPYTNSAYDKWWPLHYYLASAYEELSHIDEAIEGFLKVMELNPSHLQSAEQLALLYEKKGDWEKSEKYSRKAEIISYNKEV